MSKKNCRIPASEPTIPEVGLGKFIDGYDSLYDSLPWGKLISIVLLSVMSVFIMIVGIRTSNMDIIVLLSLFCSPMFIIAIVMAVKLFLRRTRVFVYENGFVWETTKRNGEIIQQDQIDFNEIDGIDLPKTIRNNNATEYKFIIWSNDRQVFGKKGDYNKKFEVVGEGGWEYMSLKAIMNRWTQIGMAKINETLTKNGVICFHGKNTIEIGKNYISIDGTTFQKGHIEYEFKNGWLGLHDSTKEKKWFKKYETKIDVNSMTNKHLFLCTISNLLDITCYNPIDTYYQYNVDLIYYTNV